MPGSRKGNGGNKARHDRKQARRISNLQRRLTAYVKAGDPRVDKVERLLKGAQK